MQGFGYTNSKNGNLLLSSTWAVKLTGYANPLDLYTTAAGRTDTQDTVETA